MPKVTLDLSEAAELAEMLTFIAGWLSGNQKQALDGSLAAHMGHPAYTTGTLCAGLHRFAFLLGVSDGEEPLRRAGIMISKTGAAHALDRITRITPTMCVHRVELAEGGGLFERVRRGGKALELRDILVAAAGVAVA